jgi:hypothetical protein
MDSLGGNGVLQVIPPGALENQLQQRAQANAAASAPSTPVVPELAAYVRSMYEVFRNHRNTQQGWSERLLAALRIFNGQYDASQTAEIKKFGGSDIYARVVAQKCRAASSLLRDIYLGSDKPWAIEPPADPDIPPKVLESIKQLLMSETSMVTQYLGRPPSDEEQRGRREALMESAKDAARKRAGKQAKYAEDKIEEYLRNGSFYHAFAEFLVDLAIFPFACIKGPVVRIVPEVVWPPNGGQPTVKHVPRLTWTRVSPFDLWFTPGVADIENADTIEKLSVTRAELNDLLDLPGYDANAIRTVLDEYGRGGLYDNWDYVDHERAVLESRENPQWNRSRLISMMEFNGNVQGRTLQEYGMAVPDELRDYHVQVWVIGNYVIKVNLSPSPRQRHPYFITSFEKVPGTPVGNGLTDLLSDLQQAGNATLRALINNLAISSGPQVVINDDRLSPEETGEQLFPWKRWHTRNDPLGHNTDPISFFQPQNNSQQLMEVYKQFIEIADDVSAIPKYIGGGAAGSGAGRTASGLAMLMGNSSKILQTVSANVDRDVVEPAMLQLVDLIMLTDTTGLLTGEEKVTVAGVSVAVQRETMRQRQMEYLQHTNNPTDMKIIGIKGRAEVLRSVSDTLGMQSARIVPTEDALEKMQQDQQKQEENGPLHQEIDEAVTKGVGAGIKRIATELTAAGLAMEEQMGMGPPTHIGTEGGPPAQANGGQPPAGHGTTKSIASGAAKAQGNQPPKSNASMGPQTHLLGNQPSNPSAKPSAGAG